MEFELKFKSIATQWFLQMFLLVAAVVIIVEVIVCSFLRAINIENLRAHAADYARQFSVLATVEKEDFHSAAFKFIEEFQHKDKLEIQIIDSEGNVFISSSGFMPTKNAMPDYLVALKSTSGSSYLETFSEDGEPLLCGTILLADMGEGSNGAIRWLVSLKNTNSYCFKLYLGMILIGVAILGVTAFSGYYFIKSVVRPIRRASVVAKKIAAGNFDARVPVRGNDEVAELAKAFNNMADSLSRLEVMRNTFVANVSHDLRTPMTTISGFIDNILSGAIPTEKRDYYLKLIRVEVARLARLVTSLLDISRIQAGDRKFDFQPFDICEMARRILISFENKIEAKHLDVEFVCDKERMIAQADHDAVYQILYNICDNAVKFSRESGKLSLSLSQNKEHKVVVSVYNEGEGIATADLPFVFERFYKVDKSRSTNKDSTGLGLYIVKTIIKK